MNFSRYALKGMMMDPLEASGVNKIRSLSWSGHKFKLWVISLPQLSSLEAAAQKSLLQDLRWTCSMCLYLNNANWCLFSGWATYLESFSNLHLFLAKDNTTFTNAIKLLSFIVAGHISWWDSTWTEWITEWTRYGSLGQIQKRHYKPLKETLQECYQRKHIASDAEFSCLLSCHCTVNISVPCSSIHSHLSHCLSVCLAVLSNSLLLCLCLTTAELEQCTTSSALRST